MFYAANNDFTNVYPSVKEVITSLGKNNIKFIGKYVLNEFTGVHILHSTYSSKGTHLRTYINRDKLTKPSIFTKTNIVDLRNTVLINILMYLKYKSLEDKLKLLSVCYTYVKYSKKCMYTLLCGSLKRIDCSISIFVQLIEYKLSHLNLPQLKVLNASLKSL